MNPILFPGLVKTSATLLGAASFLAPPLHSTAHNASASCRTIPCLQRQVNQLRTQVKALDAFVTTCIYEASVGVDANGYLVSEPQGSGQPVAGWLMIDGCNSQSSAITRQP